MGNSYRGGWSDFGLVENCVSEIAVKARHRSVTLYCQAKAVEVEEERLHWWQRGGIHIFVGSAT